MVKGNIGELAPRDHAEAIGQLIIAWSELDHAAGDLIMKLGPLDPSYGDVILGHIDFREKLAIVRSLGFVRQPNDEWFAFLEKTVNQIDNVLRPLRNRVVHNAWTFLQSGDAMQINREPKLLRPESHKRVLDVLRTKRISAQELATWVKWAKFALAALQLLLEMPLSSREMYPWQCLDWT